MRKPPFILLLFLFSLLAHLSYIYDLNDYEFRDHLDLDPKAYDEKAVSILNGEDPSGGRPFYQSPLYAYFLAAVYKTAERNYTAVRLLQALLGALSVVLLYRIGGVLFDRSTGRIAGAAAALYAPLLFYEAQIMKTPLSVFLILLGCFLLLEKRGVLPALLAGLSLGLAALVRENAVLFLAAAAFFVLWGGSPGKGSVRRALLVVLGGVLVIAPVTIHNHARSGDFIPITSQGGQNFYIGNNETAKGTYTVLPFVRPDPRYEENDFRTETARRLGEESSPAAISNYWYGESFRWMRENRVRAVSLFWKKTLLFWNHRELPDNENFYYMRERFRTLRILPLTFGMIAPFALVGMIAGIRRFRSLFLAYAGVGVTCAALVAFYIFSRYRLAAVPFLLLFAAHGGSVLLNAFRGKSFGKALLLTIGTLIAFLAVLLPDPIDFDPRVDGYLPLHVNRAMLFAEEGNVARAIDEYREALDIAPERDALRKRLARLLRDKGRDDEALLEMIRIAERLPDDAGIRNDIALLYLKMGEREKALHYLEEAVWIDPALIAPHRNLGRLLIEAGRIEEGTRQTAIADSLRAGEE